MQRTEVSIYLAGCSDTFTNPKNTVGSFWKQISGNLKRLRKLTHGLGYGACSRLKVQCTDLGQKIHLTGEKGFEVKI